MNYPKCSSLPLSALLFSWAIGCGSTENETSNTDDDTPAAASEVSFELGEVSDPLLGQFFRSPSRSSVSSLLHLKIRPIQRCFMPPT